MKISVIMLTCDREALVGRAIQCVLDQDFPSFELIVVDNGSRDGSGRVAEQYAARDKRVRVLHRGRGNIGSGRNAGLDAARGEYIAFVDDDDTMDPDYLSFLYGLAEHYGADAAVCGSWKEVEGRRLPNCVDPTLLVMGPEEAVRELLRRKRYNAATPTKLWRRQLFRLHRFREEGRYDDITIVYRLFAQAEKTVFQGVPKYCFTRHPGNNSRFTTDDSLLTPEQLEEYFAAFRERTDYLTQTLPGIGEYAKYSEFSYLLSMCHKLEEGNLPACAPQLARARGELLREYGWFSRCPYLQGFEREWLARYVAPHLGKGG